VTAFRDSSFDGETLFGTFYPKGYIVAVTHQKDDAEAAIAELQQAGFTDVRLWSGSEVQERHQAFLHQRSMLQRIGSTFAADEKLALDEYLQAAEEGHSFVTVHVVEQSEIEPVRNTLVAHHAHQMHYYGDVGMTDLAP
jgi:hypothetical protein